MEKQAERALNFCSFVSSLSWADGRWVAWGTSPVCPDGGMNLTLNWKIAVLSLISHTCASEVHEKCIAVLLKLQSAFICSYVCVLIIAIEYACISVFMFIIHRSECVLIICSSVCLCIAVICRNVC